MDTVKALVYISIPGKWTEEDEGILLHLTDHPIILWIISVLEKNRIPYQSVDTIAGWGNLNQDWLEFRTEVETSFGWCRPTIFSPKENRLFLNLLNRGEILFQLSYIQEKNGEESFIEHH